MQDSSHQAAMGSLNCQCSNSMNVSRLSRSSTLLLCTDPSHLAALPSRLDATAWSRAALSGYIPPIVFHVVPCLSQEVGQLVRSPLKWWPPMSYHNVASGMAAAATSGVEGGTPVATGTMGATCCHTRGGGGACCQCSLCTFLPHNPILSQHIQYHYILYIS